MVWEAVIDWVCFASSFDVIYAGFLLHMFPFIAHPENSCSLFTYEFQWLHLLHCLGVMWGSVVKPSQYTHHFSSHFITLVAGIALWFYAQSSGDLEGLRGEHEHMMPLYISFHSNSRIVLIKVWLGSNWFLRLCFFSWKTWSKLHYMELCVPDYPISFCPGRRLLLVIFALPDWLTKPPFNWRFVL